MRINKVVILILVVAISNIFIPFVKADDSNGLVLSPIGSNIKLKNGESYSGLFTITNNEKTELNIEFKEGDIINNNPTNLSDLAWYTIPAQITAIPNNEKVEVPFTIRVPDNATEGYYPKALIINFLSEDASSSVTAQLVYRTDLVVESLFDSQSGVIIKSFTTNQKFFIDGNINIAATVGNLNGNSLSKPIGYLNIINPIGQIVYTTVLNESASAITSDRIFTENAHINTDNIQSLGQYTAQILFTDTLTNKSTVQKVSFFLVDKKIVLISVIVLIAIVLLIKYTIGLKRIVKQNNTKPTKSKLGEHK